MGVIILRKMMQNYSFDLFLANYLRKSPPMTPTACYNNVEII